MVVSCQERIRMVGSCQEHIIMVGSCQERIMMVGSCQERIMMVGSCQERIRMVGSCQEPVRSLPGRSGRSGKSRSCQDRQEAPGGFQEASRILAPQQNPDAQALYIHIIPIRHSYLYTLLIACHLHYTSIPSIHLDTLVVQVH